MSTCSSDYHSDNPKYETCCLCTHAGHIEIFHLQPHQLKWDEYISVDQNSGHQHVSQSKIHCEVNDFMFVSIEVITSYVSIYSINQITTS